MLARPFEISHREEYVAEAPVILTVLLELQQPPDGRPQHQGVPTALTMTKQSKSLPRHLPEPMRDRRQLGPEDTFRFGCHEGLKCFTRCCGDVNIFLTPLDVLRLARHLGLSTTDFLTQHTLTPFTKELSHCPSIF